MNMDAVVSQMLARKYPAAMAIKSPTIGKKEKKVAKAAFP